MIGVVTLLLAMQQPAVDIQASSAGRAAVLEGAVDMPDGTILDVYFRTTSDQLMWNGPPGCSPGAEPDDTWTLYTIARVVDLVAKRQVKVRGGKFSGAFDDVPPGLYTVAIMYARAAQKDEAVVRTLGEKYMDWTATADFSHVDPRSLADALQADRARAIALIDQLEALREIAGDRSGRGAWHFGSFHRELAAFERAVAEARGGVFSATLDGLGQSLSTLKRAPGGSEETVLGHERAAPPARGRAPEFSRCTLAQEQFLVAMRCARWAWAKDRETWRACRAEVKRFIDAIRAGVPDKSARTAAQERTAVWCDKCTEALDLLDGTVEGEGEDRRAALEQCERLLSTLRRIAK